MHHRVQITPFTRINEHWVFDNRVDSSPSEPYKDTLITDGVDHRLYTNIVNSPSNWYKHIAIDIVTESTFNYPYPQITEKTLRPILCNRMFMIVGPSGSLAWLHSKGFRTFAPFINEDYDSIQNPTDRIITITSEIKRLCELPITTIKSAMMDYADTLTHNFNLLKNMESIELDELEEML